MTKRYVCEECLQQWPIDEASALMASEHEVTTGHHVFLLNTPLDTPLHHTYELLDEDTAIKCYLCGLVSHHPKDVEQRYCGKCHFFHGWYGLDPPWPPDGP